MEHVPRQQYTKEFREHAVQLVLAQQVPITEAARRGQLATLGENRRPVTELSRLKRDLVEARMERDILKKTITYFVKAQLPSTR